MVCSMRPMTPENAKKAYEITEKMPNVHGAPVQMGDPEAIGVTDIMNPDYGEAVDIYPGEIPVFWPCGVTPQAAVENAKPPIVITHAPGHMFITDISNATLNEYLEKKKKKADKPNYDHVVQVGESMHSIAQKYGIQIKSLYKMNKKHKDYIPEEGDVLKLR